MHRLSYSNSVPDEINQRGINMENLDEPKKEEEKSKGKISIENGVLFVTVDLTQKHGKILALGILQDAIACVTEYFLQIRMLRMQKEQREGLIRPVNGGARPKIV